MVYNGFYASPIGNISIVADDEALHKLSFTEATVDATILSDNSPVIEYTKQQLGLYFSNQLRKFDLPLLLKATEFQKRVLEEVQKIPYGQTVTYMQLAKRLGSTRLTRAVAAVNAANSFLIVIPCHRVVGKNSSMTGYAGEIWRKEWLLTHENALAPCIL